MSWASNRQTTREEDKAYGLLGLFQVNMPLIYGEGSRAFRRLQEEILKNSQDLTIFAWSTSVQHSITSASTRYSEKIHSSATFANSLTAFRHREYRLKPFEPPFQKLSYSYRDRDNLKLGYDKLQGTSVSNIGISISLFMVPFAPGIFFVPLCYVSESASAKSTWLEGMLIEQTSTIGAYRRLCNGGKCLFPAPIDHTWGSVKTVMLKHGRIKHIPNANPRTYSFCVDQFSVLDTSGTTKTSAVIEVSRFSHNPKPAQEHHLRFDRREVPCGILAILQVDIPGSSSCCLLFGADSDLNIFCLATQGGVDNTQHEICGLLVAVPHLRRTFDIANNHEVLQLISSVQASESNKKAAVDADGVGLGVMSWTETRAVMELCGFGRVTIDRRPHNQWELGISVEAVRTPDIPSSVPKGLYTCHGPAKGEHWQKRRLGLLESQQREGSHNALVPSERPPAALLIRYHRVIPSLGLPLFHGLQAMFRYYWRWPNQPRQAWSDHGSDSESESEHELGI